jgi:hypothetical protein
MIMKIDEIPYLTHIPRDGRSLLLQPWYDVDSAAWHNYWQINPGEFIRMQIVGFTCGIYYATKPFAPDDLEVPLANLIAQHLSFPTVAEALYSLIDDVHLLSATMEKLELLRTLSLSKDEKISSFLVETELEYLFTLIRSMYDVLQTIAKGIGKVLVKADGRPIKQLPDSFADIALYDNTPRTFDNLQTKYELPPPLAKFYVAESVRFLLIRQIRTELEHRGKRLPSVFVTEQGFGISTKWHNTSWSNLDVWKMHELQPNDIGSVRALAAFLSESFLNTINNFEQSLRNTIAPALLPPAVSNGNNIYLTNPSVGRLLNLASIYKDPWSKE